MTIIPPMAFEVIRDSIIENVLLPAQGNIFRTIRAATPHLGSEGVLDQRQTVAVYNSKIDYGGSIVDPWGDMTFDIELSVAAEAQVDLLVLEQDFAEAEEQAIYRTALEAVETAEILCDQRLDKLHRIVFQIIMNAQNNELGVDRITAENPLDVQGEEITVPGFRVQGRMIKKFEKGSPQRDKNEGNLVRMGGVFTLECRAREKIQGEVPIVIAGGGDFDVTLELNEETTPKAGVFISTKT